mgnify:CR=1 FL=1
MPIASNYLIIIQAPLAEPTITLPETGIKLATYAYQRQIPDVKTTDYLMAVWLQPWMKQQGADDILYYYNGIKCCRIYCSISH